MSPRPGCCWLTRAVSCAWWPPPAKPPGCLSYSRSRTIRAPAWTASGRAGPSSPWTWRPKRSGGRGSRPPPGRPDSPPCRPCRCGCASRSSARLTSSGPTRAHQGLADVATISLLQERSMRHNDTLNEQLQTALNSRVIIEQAKGKLAERLGLDMDQAFNLLRDYARTSNRRLSDLAQAFVDGTDTLTRLTAGTSQPRLGGDGHPRRPAARPRL